MNYRYYLLYQHRSDAEDVCLLIARRGDNFYHIVRNLGCFELMCAVSLHVALYETYGIRADDEGYKEADFKTMYPGSVRVELTAAELREGANPTYRKRPMTVYLCENTEPGMIDYELMFSDGFHWWEINIPDEWQKMSTEEACKNMRREFAFVRDVYRLFQAFAHPAYELEFAAGYTPEKWAELDGCIMHKIKEEWG